MVYIIFYFLISIASNRVTTGIKTGHTTEAGYCLVSSAYKDGKSILLVVLDSTEEGRFEDSIRLLKYGFNNNENNI